MAKKVPFTEATCLPRPRTLSPFTRVESSAAVRGLASIYSLLLEERVSPGRTLRLLHAQLAVLLLLLPADLHLGLRALLLAWAALAVWQCRAR